MDLMACHSQGVGWVHLTARLRSSPAQVVAWGSASPASCCVPAPRLSAALDPSCPGCRAPIPYPEGRSVPLSGCATRRDFRAIDAFVQRVVDTHGRLDILVNNAGGTVPTPQVEAVPELVQKIQGAPRGDDEYERTALFHAFAVQMNLISPLWFAIRAYRQMREQDGTGRSINISSGAGHPAGSPTLVSYGAAQVRA